MSQAVVHAPSVRVFQARTLATHAPAMRLVIAAMREHLATPLSLEEMAAIACLSPFHFNRLFRAITGTPPGEFLAALRLQEAKRLLLTSSASVTDICFDLGYASLGSFATRFKSQVGVSPHQFRLLAARLAQSTPQTFISVHNEARLRAVRRPTAAGFVVAPPGFAGTIFVGLFPKPIPQGRPIACVTLAAPGAFSLSSAALVPDGLYYLLAAALPWSSDPRAYLAPDNGLLVGMGRQPVTVFRGQTPTLPTLVLRPLDPTDPPILGVFPPLLTSVCAAPAR